MLLARCQVSGGVGACVSMGGGGEGLKIGLVDQMMISFHLLALNPI